MDQMHVQYFINSFTNQNEGLNPQTKEIQGFKVQCWDGTKSGNQ